MFRRISASLFTLLLLAGCSSTNRAYYDTLKIAFTQADKTVTSEQLRKNKGDLLAVKHGERVQVIMALAYIEDDTQTWVSADDALFTMQNGVIVETHGLANDLIFHSALPENPLMQPQPMAQSWQFIVDVEGYGYGLDVSTRWQRSGQQTLTILDASFDTYVVEEHVSFTGAKPFYETNTDWVNRYWFDVNSAEMLKSEQKLSPVGDPIVMVFLSRAQRLIDGREAAR